MQNSETIANGNIVITERQWYFLYKQSSRDVKIDGSNYRAPSRSGRFSQKWASHQVVYQKQNVANMCAVPLDGGRTLLGVVL